MADPAAVAAAAEAIAMIDPPNKARLSLRSFEGREDSQDARDFVAKVAAYAGVARLTNEETVQSVQFAFVPNSVAAKWLASLGEEDPDAVLTWTALQPHVLERFSPDMTPSQRAAAVEVCRQTKAESVLAFMDRCRATQLSLDRYIPANQKTGGEQPAYLDRYNKSVLEIFLRGLREEGGLKTHVNGANAVTRAEYLAEALRYEKHVLKPLRVAVVAEIENDEDDGEGKDDAEVANVAKTKGKQRNKKKGAGGGQNNGTKGGGNGNAKTNGGGGGRNGNQGRGKGQSGGANSGPKLCWNCNSSEHLSYNCPEKKTSGGGGNGGGGGGGGNGQRRSGGGGAQNFAQPQLKEVLGKYLVDSFVRANQGQQSNQGALESLAYQAQSNQGHNGNPFQGFQ